MGKSSGTKRRRKKAKKAAARVPAESPRTEAMTVAWMLSTLFTLGALVCAGIAALVISRQTALGAEVGTLGIIPALLFVVATVTGAVALILMACTLQMRQIRPPQPIIVGSALIGCLPFVVHLVLALR